MEIPWADGEYADEDGFDDESEYIEDEDAEGEPEPTLENSFIFDLSRKLDPTASRHSWKPNEGPQKRAYECLADVTGFGGSVGGGKTYLELGLASTAHWKSVIFRREYTQIQDIVQWAKDINADQKYSYNANSKIMRLESGRSIEFAAMEQVNDWEKQKGRPRDLYAYDEATEFAEFQVRASMAWCRTTRRGQRCRIIMTFNPPTDSEGEWVTRYFGPWLIPEHPNPAKDGELRWYVMLDGEETEVPNGTPFYHFEKTIQKEEKKFPQSRTFIRSELKDNPYQDTEEYHATLQSLPEPLQSQVRRGDFSAGIDANPWQVIPTSWVKLANARWLQRTRKLRDHDDKPVYFCEHPITCIGLDVARGGKDKTVIAKRHLNWINQLLKYPGKLTPNGNAAALLVYREIESGMILYVNVDSIGYGSSAFERLSEEPPTGYGVPCNAINVALPSSFIDKSGKFRFVNLRAEMYWRLREAIDPEGEELLALPPDPELLSDLTAPRFKIMTNGIQIEPKVDLIKRIGRSPDCADAVCLSMLMQQSVWLSPGTPVQPAAPAIMGVPAQGDYQQIRREGVATGASDDPWGREAAMRQSPQNQINRPVRPERAGGGLFGRR